MRPAKGWIEKILIFLIISILILLLVLPLAALALRSVVRLEASRGEREFVLPGLTGEYYRELFINRRQSLFYVPPILALRNSLLYATVASLIALIMGFMAASTLTSRKPWMAVLDPILMLPIGTSAVTLGLGFIVAFARQPNARELFPILIPIAHSLVALPFVVRVLQPALGSIPASLPQSAAVLGASPFQVWRRVQLPIAARAAAVAGLFAFTISLGEFGATAFLSRPDIPTLPVAIFRFLSLPGALNYGQALAMATMLMCLCAAVMIIIDKINLNPNTK